MALPGGAVCRTALLVLQHSRSRARRITTRRSLRCRMPLTQSSDVRAYVSAKKAAVAAHGSQKTVHRSDGTGPGGSTSIGQRSPLSCPARAPLTGARPVRDLFEGSLTRFPNRSGRSRRRLHPSIEVHHVRQNGREMRPDPCFGADRAMDPFEDFEGPLVDRRGYAVFTTQRMIFAAVIKSFSRRCRAGYAGFGQVELYTPPAVSGFCPPLLSERGARLPFLSPIPKSLRANPRTRKTPGSLLCEQRHLHCTTGSWSVCFTRAADRSSLTSILSALSSPTCSDSATWTPALPNGRRSRRRGRSCRGATGQ